MGRILIRKVSYEGENFTFETPELTGGLAIVEGKNGNGKSTFMNLIYYGFGGKVEEFSKSNKETHSQITKDKNNFVRLDIFLNEEPIGLIRYIDSNDITVLTGNGEAKVYPLNRSKNEKHIFSDWILEKLAIDPVEVFQGIHTSKINFKDLLRLVYYNQELNPRKIYKPADSENFIADSELVRKIIFELLVGKSYSEYYTKLAEFKEKEKDRNLAKAVLEEFDASTKLVSIDAEYVNLTFLRRNKEEKERQLEKLYLYRDSLKEEKRPKSHFQSETNELKSKILEAELKLNEKSRSNTDLLDELSKLRRLRENVILEVTQISKIIHAHEKLSLFSADTCPYCLREVSRENGHCVCGNEIAEEQYERFFYSSDEYSDILKSKQKSIETIDIAIKACQQQLTEVIEEINKLNSSISEYQDQVSNWITQYDFTGNSQELKQADDTILSVRTEINSIAQKIEIEERRENFQNRYSTINNEYEKLKNQVKILEGKANADIKQKIEEFNVIYNDLMTSTLSNCKNASIDFEDYMPVVDNGIYKEASASVSIRMMYFFTLLKLSLDNTEVKFPRLLLIDTPETAGVDAENLKAALSQISLITKGHSKAEYQIILTTGAGKYPDEFKDSVIIKLTDDDKLLKSVSRGESKEAK